MFPVNDFIAVYENYSDQELLKIYSNINNYSAEAQEALQTVLTKKGGLEEVLKRADGHLKAAAEIKRIGREVESGGYDKASDALIEKLASTSFLSRQQVKEAIEKKCVQIRAEKADQKIGTRTIVGSITGGLLASVIGGILWGLHLMYAERIFVIFYFGLALLCYGIIWLATRQSKKNVVVLIATILSFMLALLLGSSLPELVSIL